MKKIASLSLFSLAASMMSACASYDGDQTYADQSCNIIRQMARAEFLDRELNAYRQQTDPDEGNDNDIISALIQSDENKEKLARKKHYTEKC